MPRLASCSDVQYPGQAAWVAYVALVQAVHQALLASAELGSRRRYVYAIWTSLKLNPTMKVFLKIFATMH